MSKINELYSFILNGIDNKELTLDEVDDVVNSIKKGITIISGTIKSLTLCCEGNGITKNQYIKFSLVSPNNTEQDLRVFVYDINKDPSSLNKLTLGIGTEVIFQCEIIRGQLFMYKVKSLIVKSAPITNDPHFELIGRDASTATVSSNEYNLSSSTNSSLAYSPGTITK